MSADILQFTPMHEASNRIRLLRTGAKMSQQSLADLIHVSKMTVSDLERGEVALTLDYMRRIAKVFSVAPADILNEEDHNVFLNSQEAQLIQRYREADPVQREMISRVAAPRGEVNSAEALNYKKTAA